MNILIPGISLPPKGKIRTLVLFDDGMMIDNADGQNQWKAIELPPHGRLIDLDELVPDSQWNDYEDEYTAYSIYAIRAACIPADPEKEETT